MDTIINNDIPLEFTKGVEVICIRKASKFFGQRGTIYGTGPSGIKQLPHVFVQWHSTNERHSYLHKNLAVAAKVEAAYLKNERKVKGGKISIHEVPAETKPRPTIYERTQV